MEKIWYAYQGKKYNGEMPCYFNVQDFDWARMLEEKFPIIQKEIEAYLQESVDSFEPYFNTSLVEKLKSWKTSNFIFWGKKIESNCKKLPETVRLLESIPGMISFGFSVLEAGAHIKPHHGDTNAVMRCHLGLKIPAPAPVCALKVEDDVRGWAEGKLLMFCDAWKHEAWNKTDQPRYLLIFDVMHPQYLSQRKKVCSNVRSWLDLQKFYQKRPRFRTAHKYIKIFIRQCLRLKYRF